MKDFFLAPSVHLAGCLLKPKFTRSSPLAGLLTVSAAYASEPITESYGCPYLTTKFYAQDGTIFERIQSWWDSLTFPDFSGLRTGLTESSSESKKGLPPPGSYHTQIMHSSKLKPCERQSCFDYVKLIQLILSIIGIGLSLRLMFYLIEQINPTAKEKRLARKRAEKLFSQMGMKSIPHLTDYEVGIAVNLVDSRILVTDWESIGGLDSLINELRESVIAPFEQTQLMPDFQSKLLRPPKGVLLFGPPGCGKTMLARAMAKAARASFINLQISTLVNMWYGETQKYVEATFTLLHKLQPCILFIDEVDSFLTTRSCTDNESTRMIKTQFMALWDGLLTEEHNRILIIGATNRPEDLDQAILRRLPYKVLVPMPDAEQRFQILSIYLRDEPMAAGLSSSSIMEIASKADGLSGSDLMELSREAAFCCYRTSPQDMLLRTEHFSMALEKFHRNRVQK